MYDEDALTQILHNLLDNAEKYTRDCEERRVRVELVEWESGVRISVLDSGSGISEGQASSVFHAFRRHVSKDGPAGLGLGLSLARQLAEEQGGSLKLCKSSLGGAGFALELPAV